MHPIPAKLNLLLSFLAGSANLALLWFACHTDTTGALLCAALVFSFTNNTCFSLLHEAVHGVFHPDTRVNRLAGILLAAFFPTGYTYQRICHLGHHQRNRSEAERFDYYKPGENRPLKFLQWYGIITGIYWAFVPVSALLFALLPDLTKLSSLGGKSGHILKQSGAKAMLSGFAGVRRLPIRLETLYSICFQATIFFALDLNVTGYLACYIAFGLNWGALQYADHAFSELDARSGAWDLRIGRIPRAMFLNYHLHRAHHMKPDVPWIYLERYVDETRERPTFLSIYLQMWKGPRPLPEETFES